MATAAGSPASQPMLAGVSPTGVPPIGASAATSRGGAGSSDRPPLQEGVTAQRSAASAAGSLQEALRAQVAALQQALALNYQLSADMRALERGGQTPIPSCTSSRGADSFLPPCPRPSSSPPARRSSAIDWMMNDGSGSLTMTEDLTQSLQQPLLEGGGGPDSVTAGVVAKVQGNWKCTSNEWFFGSAVTFTDSGWYPHEPLTAGDRHEWTVQEDHIQLHEWAPDGQCRTFELTPVPGSKDELLVSEDLGGERTQFVLRRAAYNSQTVDIFRHFKSSYLGDKDFKRSVEQILNSQKKDLKSSFVDESHMYKDSGVFVGIVNSSIFHYATMLVISANTLWIAVDTDYNKFDFLDEAPLLFQVVDNFFCSYFVFEIAVRVLAMKRPCKAFMDAWVAFDVFLVLTMVWETWVVVLAHVFLGRVSGTGGTSFLRIFRIFRLARIARMVRLLRWMPELLILIKGLAVAMRSVCNTVSLLLVVIYVFGVLFTQVLDSGAVSEGDKRPLSGAFDTVPLSMHTLLVQVVCGFDSTLLTNLLAAGWEYYVLLLFFHLIGSLTILNLLIGVLCEVVSNVSTSEKEIIDTEFLESKVAEMVGHLDADLSGSLTEAEFMELMRLPEVLTDLQRMDIDVVSFMDFTRFVFMDTREMSVADFQRLVKQFRGSKVATVKDIVDMNKFITMELRSLERHLVTRIRSGVHG